MHVIYIWTLSHFHRRIKKNANEKESSEIYVAREIAEIAKKNCS